MKKITSYKLRVTRDNRDTPHTPNPSPHTSHLSPLLLFSFSVLLLFCFSANAQTTLFNSTFTTAAELSSLKSRNVSWSKENSGQIVFAAEGSYILLPVLAENLINLEITVSTIFGSYLHLHTSVNGKVYTDQDAFNSGREAETDSKKLPDGTRYVKFEAASGVENDVFLISVKLTGKQQDVSQPHKQIVSIHFTEKSKKISIPREAFPFPEIHEGTIAIWNDGKMLYVNTKGEYVFGSNFPIANLTQFDHSCYFSGGAAMVYYKDTRIPCIIYPDGKYRLFPTGTKDANGNSTDVTAASRFCEGYAIVKKGSGIVYISYHYIDKNGKEVFPQLTCKSGKNTMDMTVYPMRENRRVFFDTQTGKYGYADATGNIVIKPQFDKAHTFSEGMAAVMFKEGFSEKKWGFIDLSGKLVIPATYKLEPGRFSEGLAPVKIGESDSDYEMTYIDKSGARAMERKPWDLNEFHNDYAWVKKETCDKLVVINRKFEEVRDLTPDFYHHGNGNGVCLFDMQRYFGLDRLWGFDFPNGMRNLSQLGVGPGDVFAPNGIMLFHCIDENEYDIPVHSLNEGGLMYVEYRATNEPRLKNKDISLPCFINQKGEIVFYFEQDYEGYEGPTPVQVK